MRRDVALVVAVVVALALHHLLAGPSITADDWVWVRNGEFLGWWDAGGSRQIGRPGAYALYALVFGLGGAHPLVHALVQVGLWAGAAVAVLLALRAVLDDARLALTITLVWLLAPSHTSLELWASTSQAWIAIGLLAVGARILATSERRWPAYVALGAAGAFYEVAILAAPVVAVAVDRARTHRWRPRTAIVAGAACAPALLWSLASATVYSDEIATTEQYWIEHLAGSLGMGLPIESRGAAALVVLAALGAVAFVRQRGTALDRGLVAAGGALVVAGTIPALRSYTIPYGMGDRLTAVSGIGAALLWTGAARPLLARTTSRPLRIGLAVAAVLLAHASRLDNLTEWVDVGDDGVRAAATLAAEAADDTDHVLVHEGSIAEGDEFYGIYDGWNATAAAQVAGDDPTIVVQVDIDCIRSGPLADDPLEQYGRRPEQRVPGCQRDP